VASGADQPCRSLGDPSLDDIRFAVVDVETNGLTAGRHRVLQIAVVVARADGTVEDRFSSLLRPPWGRWSRVGPRRIHGIRRRDLARAPDPSFVASEVARRLRGAVFTAHNVAFDWPFVVSLLGNRRHDGPSDASTWLGCPQLCTLTLSRSLDPDRVRSHRLGDVCARYGVELTRAHDALADAEATATLLPHLLREAGITDVDQLESVLER
jgi:DNA polymerase-3 subunit epsilon